MHPAPSMILFTVFSGIGLGAMASIGLGIGGHGHLFGWIAGVLALAMTGLGGVASVGHLGRPDRAWRAFTQWRSSWLSREAVAMMAAMAVFALYLALWLLWDLRLYALGWAAAALAAVTVYSTAMIYAQLRTVPRWSATPTAALFLIVAAAGGLLVNALGAALAGGGGPDWLLVVALVAAAAAAIWWQTEAAGAGRSHGGSTAETATGLAGLGRVRLLEPPHTGSSYLLTEMAYVVARRRAFQIRLIGAICGFLVPLALAIVAIWVASWLLVVALVSHVAGMLALRWLFFAEAEHVQALYYGRR